jgi:predicted metal-dependent phosphoesterase TrpH
MEIRTELGDIIGLFLMEEISSRELRRVVEEVRSQNGIVMLPHPFKNHRITPDLMSQIDVVEIFNARCSPEENKNAMDLARKHNKPGVFGSDAHLRGEIGTGYCEINGSGDFGSIKEGILRGATAIVETYSSRWNIVASQMVKMSRGGQIPSVGKIFKGIRRILKESFV